MANAKTKSAKTKAPRASDFDPLRVGNAVFIRTVTTYYTGRVLAVMPDGGPVLGDAAWIADTGRFADAMRTGVFSEVEPYPAGMAVRVPSGPIVDIVTWPHALGFPAFSFKRCMVGACRQVEDLPMTVACTLFHVMADDLSTGLVRLGEHSDPVQREDVVRLQTGVASLAFRPQFDQWGFDLRLRFNPKVISLQSLVNLLELAGSACGIGDWRPERKGGPFGMFEIDGERFGQQQKAA